MSAYPFGMTTLEQALAGVSFAARDLEPPTCWRPFRPHPRQLQFMAALQASATVADFAKTMRSLNRTAGATQRSMARLERQLVDLQLGSTIYGVAVLPYLVKRLGCTFGRHRWSHMAARCWTCGVSRAEVVDRG